MDKSAWKSKREQKTRQYFCDALGEEVEQWCKVKGIEVTASSVVAYMVKHNLLQQASINRYVVMHSYRRYFDQEGTKTKAVLAMSNLIPLEPRQIYLVMSNHCRRFHPNQFVYEVG